MWAHLHSRHVYLDANILIEALEGVSARARELRGLLALVQSGSVLATTSEWTLAEVLVRPLALGAADLAARYQQILSGAGPVAIAPVSRAVLLAAARYCAQTRMPLPDCLHVASAVQAGCDVFMTNDRGIVLPSSMERG